MKERTEIDFDSIGFVGIWDGSVCLDTLTLTVEKIVDSFQLLCIYEIIMNIVK